MIVLDSPSSSTTFENTSDDISEVDTGFSVVYYEWMKGELRFFYFYALHRTNFRGTIEPKFC